jgi:hypothetical protein
VRRADVAQLARVLLEQVPDARQHRVILSIVHLQVLRDARAEHDSDRVLVRAFDADVEFGHRLFQACEVAATAAAHLLLLCARLHGGVLERRKIDRAEEVADGLGAGIIARAVRIDGLGRIPVRLGAEEESGDVVHGDRLAALLEVHRIGVQLREFQAGFLKNPLRALICNNQPVYGYNTEILCERSGSVLMEWIATYIAVDEVDHEVNHIIYSARSVKHLPLSCCIAGWLITHLRKYLCMLRYIKDISVQVPATQGAMVGQLMNATDTPHGRTLRTAASLEKRR